MRHSLPDSAAAIATNRWPYPEVPASLPNPAAAVANGHTVFILRQCMHAALNGVYLRALGICIQRSNIANSARTDLVRDAVPARALHGLQKVQHAAQFE